MINSKNRAIRTLCVICLICSFFLITVTAASPYKSFTYDLNDDSVAAPESGVFYTAITGETLGISGLNEPSDICSDINGNLYISDKLNGRIVKTDRYGGFIAVVDKFVNAGETQSFKEPEGLAVTENGDIYICDTGNRRIIQLNRNFEFIKEITSPKSAALGKEFLFTPVRIAVDRLSRMYIVSRNFNAGLIELDKNGEFNQIFGSVKVQYSAVELLWRKFSTKAQQKRSTAFVPNEYSSVCMDENDFIYACSAYFDSSSGNTSGSVKKLNGLGTNILKGLPDEMINRYAKGTYAGPETFVDVAALGNDNYALLDNTRGRVFVYNNDGDLLFCFGGKGDLRGTLGAGSALCYSDGFFYIVDSKNDCISVFRLTDYAQGFLKAAALHKEGDYKAENEIWKNIYKQNNNSICTIRNFGRVNFREGNYKEAMRCFKLANDKDGYSESFSASRKAFINKYFVWIFSGAAVLIAGLAAYFWLRGKRKGERRKHGRYLETLLYAKQIIFRPIHGFWEMKKENYGSIGAAATIFSSVALLYAFTSTTKGFIFDGSTSKGSFVMGLLTVIAPFVLFIICNWGVTNLMSGEGSLKYIFMGTSYALTPMAFSLPVLWLLSHILTAEEQGIYFVVTGVVFLWTMLLIICSNMEVQNYTFGKTILVLLITVLVMVIVVFLAALVFALLQQIIGVASDMVNEIYLRT